MPDLVSKDDLKSAGDGVVHTITMRLFFMLAAITGQMSAILFALLHFLPLSAPAPPPTHADASLGRVVFVADKPFGWDRYRAPPGRLPREGPCRCGLRKAERKFDFARSLVAVDDDCRFAERFLAKRVKFDDAGEPRAGARDLALRQPQRCFAGVAWWYRVRGGAIYLRAFAGAAARRGNVQ